MNVLIADDHPLFRRILSLMLKQMDTTSEIIEAGTAAEVFKAVLETSFDLILLDLSMPDCHELEILTALAAQKSKAKIVIFSSREEPEIIFKSMTAGAAGYIPKSTQHEIIPQIINLVMAGGLYLPPHILSCFTACPTKNPDIQATKQPLTERQIEVMHLIRQGMNNKDISRELGISLATVKAHVTAIMRALHVQQRTQVWIAADKYGLL